MVHSPPLMSSTDPLCLQRVIGWLLEASARSLDAPALISELCERLNAEGIPLWRCSTSMLTLHPEVSTRNITWIRGEGAKVLLVPYARLEQPGYTDSPVRFARENKQQLRVRLGPGDDPIYGPLRELQEKGATDYLIVPLHYRDGRTSYLSFTTDAAGGFTTEQLAILEGVVPQLSVRLELESAYYATECLMNVYLGASAAERVLAGGCKRGGGQKIRAAIWFCDLRGFTTLVDRQPIDDVLGILDRYFECTAGEVAARGGEVLKFIGDAVLAIFPVNEGGDAEACQRALDAAKAALSAFEALNAERAKSGAAALGLGIALHLGEVMYGNIGARERLDFTVIGAAVNEVTRVESLCKPLGRAVLLSQAFVQGGSIRAQSLGAHALKGVGEPMEVFGLASPVGSGQS